LGIGIGLAIPLIYHHVKGGTPLGLGLVTESICFPIFFIIAVCIMECVISKCASHESEAQSNSSIQSGLQNLSSSHQHKPKTKILVKQRIVVDVNTGAVDMQNDDEIPTRSVSLPIPHTPKPISYRDDTILLLSPTMTLATQKDDNDDFFPSNNFQSAGKSLL
jgi:hypothetical protein